jgi:trans-2,3-dihydro-3-hydroxyanthranilate isomerase
VGPGVVKARAFAGGVGVGEDPATGSAAAALALYIGARCGETSIEISQGEEVGRPSTIMIECAPQRAIVSGRVHLVADATMFLQESHPTM